MCLSVRSLLCLLLASVRGTSRAVGVTVSAGGDSPMLGSGDSLVIGNSWLCSFLIGSVTAAGGYADQSGNIDHIKGLILMSLRNAAPGIRLAEAVMCLSGCLQSHREAGRR
jgi:hypothetical protein